MTEISTVKELAALPIGTVLRCPHRLPIIQLRKNRSGELVVVVGTEWMTPAMAARKLAPLTVLHRPDLPPQTELAARIDAALRRIGALSEGEPLRYELRNLLAPGGAP